VIQRINRFLAAFEPQLSPSDGPGQRKSWRLTGEFYLKRRQQPFTKASGSSYSVAR
jgi:hypothetical protein